jgi:hypothetical protein
MVKKICLKIEERSWNNGTTILAHFLRNKNWKKYIFGPNLKIGL